MKRNTAPVWDASPMPSFAPLAENMTVDVAIIGGGISGISAAYLLVGKDLSIALIEKDHLDWGASGVTTAFLNTILDTNMSDLILIHGRECAQLIVASHREAIDRIERIVEKESIDCEFMRCPNYLYASTEDQRTELESEYAAALQIGYEASMHRDARGMRNFGALEIRGQGKFHPRKYLAALAEKTKERGVHIFEKTEALELQGDSPITVRTAHGTITARFVFIATYEPFTKPLSLYFKKGSYISYVLAGTIEKGALAEATYEDLSNPYNYFRIDADEKADRIIFGGADHRADVKVAPEKNFQALEDAAAKTLQGTSYRFDREWSGPILEPLDGLAYIGQFDKGNMFVAFGFSGNGMTYGTISAKMFADHVLGNGSPYTVLYDPGRLPDLKELYVKGRDYVGELFGGAVRNTFTYEKER